MNAMLLIDHLPVLPEVLLLLGACALMIFDLYVKDEGRGASAVFAQVVLYLCAAATLFVEFGTRSPTCLSWFVIWRSRPRSSIRARISTSGACCAASSCPCFCFRSSA